MSYATNLLAGRYLLREPLGEGGQGRVWLGRDESTGTEVALKAVAVERAASLRRELALLGGLRHPNLVEALDLCEEGQTVYLVQRHAPGLELGRWAARDRAPGRVCAALAAALRGLAYLHGHGLLHRDLKPANILVEDRTLAGLPAARLVDLGLGARVGEAEVDGAVGTPGYLAPEVMAGEPASPASDLYSLGVVLVECLTGRLPRRQLGRLEERALDGIGDGALASFLAGLLAPTPEARPGLAAVRDALARVVGRSLLPTPAELAGELRSAPRLLGREAARARLGRALEAARRGEVTRLRLCGCGTSSIAREACLSARLAGARVFAAEHPAWLLARIPAGDPAHRRSLLVDELLAPGARPFLLCLDGAEPDAEALAFHRELGLALEAGGGAGGLVLQVARAAPAELAGYETLALDPLAREATERLVLDLLAPLEPPLWLGEVQAVTGGDPRLVVELVHEQLAAGLPDRLVPAALSDRARHVARAVAALAPAERTALAAIAGSARPLPFAILEAVDREAARGVETLLRRGLISADARGLVPAHRLATLAVERDGPPAEALRALHASLASALQAYAPGALDWIGRHLLRAGAKREAARVLAEAPDAALADLEEAAAALEPTDPLGPGLLRALARRQRARGELAAALATAARLGAREREEGALLEAELLLDAGQPARALEALALLPAVGDERRARVALLEGRACIFLGRHRDAAARVMTARRLPGLSRREAARLEALAGLAAVYLGDPGPGLDALERAAALAEAAEDRETLVRAESGRGIALLALGRRAEAAAAQRRCEALARGSGDLRAAASACLNLGTLAHEGLELGEAFDCYTRAAELARRAGAATTRVAALSNLANLLLLVGDLRAVDARLAEAEETARAAGALAELGYLALYRAERLLLVGDLAGAEAELATARARLGADDARGRDAAALLEGELLARGGRGEEAGRIAAELEGRVSLGSAERFRVHLLAARAALAQVAPDRARAAAELELALALAARAGVAPLAWEAEELLARCRAELGDGEAAAWHAARCEARIRELEERVPHLFRASLVERPDLRRARASLGELRVPAPSDATPSAADLERLLALNEELNAGLPLEALLGRILELAIELTGAERGFVLLGEGDGLRLAASRNLDGESLRRGMEKLSQTIARLAIAEQRAILVEDALEDARFVDRLSVTGLRLRAVLCAPFRVRDRGHGALYVDNRFRADAFSARHVALMQAFASQAGIAITHARLVDELSRQARELAAAKAEVEAQSRALEAELATQSEALGAATLRLRAHEEELVRKYNDARIIGRSKAMRDLFASLDRVAEAEVPVLIWGESGTGKELVARAIHAHGPRRSQPFVSVNCGAIAPTLLESELFGHARGAFTGATRDRPGLFEAAGSGTLLLDEVGDMPADMQVKLLRILQEGSFRRVGEERERRSACRVLSASHKRLEELVARGAFREDLYYRLQVIQLEVPALRDRREDIPLLCDHLLGRIRPRLRIAPAALAALLDHDWPGNVRQLEHELQRAALLCEGETIEPEHLSIPLPGRGRARRAGGLREELRRVEKATIEAALREAGGVVSDAARALGLHRVVLYRRMRELGVPTPAGAAAPRSRGGAAARPRKRDR